MMYYMYCPKCDDMKAIQSGCWLDCWCGASLVHWTDLSIQISGSAVIVHICADRFKQALRELETGVSAGISGMVLKEGNGMVEITRQ